MVLFLERAAEQTAARFWCFWGSLCTGGPIDSALGPAHVPGLGLSCVPQGKAVTSREGALTGTMPPKPAPRAWRCSSASQTSPAALPFFLCRSGCGPGEHSLIQQERYTDPHEVYFGNSVSFLCGFTLALTLYHAHKLKSPV